MNGQHHIDHAEFETTFVAPRVEVDQQTSVDDFIKSELMQVIDEVFDDIERRSGDHAVRLCLEQLEIANGRT